MLLERDESCLVLIDVQEKLAPLVQNSKKMIERCHWLMRLAKDLAVVQLHSEHYPSGLGVTIEPLRNLIEEGNCIEKVQFSCFRASEFKQKLQTLQKKKLVLIGIETHVCILQSALDLISAGYEIFVVVDAVSSRSELDYQYGLKRMKQEGVRLITSEMVFFEWIGQAGTPEFKVLSKAYLG